MQVSIVLIGSDIVPVEMCVINTCVSSHECLDCFDEPQKNDRQGPNRHCRARSGGVNDGLEGNRERGNRPSSTVLFAAAVALRQHQ